MPTRVEIDEAGFRKVFESQDGPVGKDLWDRAGKVEIGAKAQAGVDTGELKASISRSWAHTSGRYRLTVQIGSSVNHALVHHEGTKPHVIRPRDAHVLRFVSGGRVTFARSVTHPGTPPNRYLSDNLKAAGGITRVR